MPAVRRSAHLRADACCGAKPCAACKAGKPCGGKGKKANGRLSPQKPKGRLAKVSPEDAVYDKAKRSRGDSAAAGPLSTLEYIEAASLGIEQRSAAYVRSRLDAAARLAQRREDKKCGASGIAANKKCSKATTGTAAKVALGAGGVAALAGTGLLAASAVKRRNTKIKGVLESIKRTKAKANDRVVAAAKAAKNSEMNTRTMDPRVRAAAGEQARTSIEEALASRKAARSELRSTLQDLKKVAPMSKARTRGFLKSKGLKLRLR